MTLEGVTEANLTACLHLAARLFRTGSSLHKASGIDAETYLTALAPGFRHNVAQGLSVAAREGDKVIGAVIACDLLDQGKGPDMPQLAAMQALLHGMEAHYLAQHPARRGEAVLVDMAFVQPESRGTGVYRQLREAAQALAVERGFTRVIGLLSSSATQHVVVQRMGHKVRLRQRLSTYEFDGQRPFATLQGPEEVWLTEGTLS